MAMRMAKRRGARKAQSRQALPRPAGLKQCSFPATYRAVKPRPAKATEKAVHREKGQGLGYVQYNVVG